MIELRFSEKWHRYGFRSLDLGPWNLAREAWRMEAAHVRSSFQTKRVSGTFGVKLEITNTVAMPYERRGHSISVKGCFLRERFRWMLSLVSVFMMIQLADPDSLVPSGECSHSTKVRI